MYCSRCGTQNKDSAKFCDSCGLDLTATTPVGAIKEPQELTEIEMVRKELEKEYEVIDELGRGGMAIVFKAKETELDREVAIKVLPFSLAFDKEFVERFQREARTSAKLEHPNIIPIYRVGKSGRVIYFVMKFLRGKPLSSVLAARGAGLPPQQIRSVLADVCRALAYAHKSGIVHRDIKPDNIMFDEHGHAVVTDFGIAKAASGGKLTGTGMSIGTPHYMSPEQAKAQALDGRSDIYSLGVVAYQCLTGGVPFDGEDSFSIGYKHIMEEIPTPPLENPEKRQLFEIVKKMMAKLPEQRFQNADELIGVLESGRSVSFTTDATMALPAMAGRLSSAPTTPLPRMTGTRGPSGGVPPTAGGERKHSVVTALVLWLLIVGAVFGGGGFYAYKQGLIFAAKPPVDSTAARDSAARDSTARHDSLVAAATDSVRRDSIARATTTHTPLAPPGTPGRLVLRGVPQGARVLVDGQQVRGTSIDIQPGVHRVNVRAAGYQSYDRQVIISPGEASTVQVQLESTGEGDVGPCDQFGPAYNQDNLCFDTRPVPLSPTLIPVGADAPVFPRQAILLIRVSQDGATMESRVYAPSNVETFNNQARDMARTLRWNPAQKNGEPVEAWVQWPFQPVRQ